MLPFGQSPSVSEVVTRCEAGHRKSQRAGKTKGIQQFRWMPFAGEF